MSTWKCIASMLLILCMLIGMPFAVSANESATEEYVTFTASLIAVEKPDDIGFAYECSGYNDQ